MKAPVPTPPTSGQPRTRVSPIQEQPQPRRLEWLARLIINLERFGRDVGGIFSLALALMTIMVYILPDITGGLLTRWSVFLRAWLGWGGLWLTPLAGTVGFWLMRRQSFNHRSEIPWVRVLALEAVVFTSLALLALWQGASLQRAMLGLDGGRIGWGLAEFLRLLLAPIGFSALPWRVLVAGFIFFFGLVLASGIIPWLERWTKSWFHPNRDLARTEGNGIISQDPSQEVDTTARNPSRKRLVLPPQFRKSFHLPLEDETPGAVPSPRDERLPGLELLSNEQAVRPDERVINQTAGLIEKTLAEFGIPAKVVGFRIGPTVTQYAVEPGFVEKPGNENDNNRQKVRVAQIAALRKDLTLALSAERLRIEAPVPGHPYIGIEVPNARVSVVRLRPILESETFYKIGSPLAIGLGRDVSGQPVVADLERMPHLLVAGTTGSGKSVCIAAITICMVMNNTPEDLRLVMIDPKMVELVRFNGLPHLMGKVETDHERILGVLRWVVAEMDRRYKVLEASHSRNIDTHNRKARHRKGMATLPRLVVLIDELADLMMAAPEQTEYSLVRLAQMARAVGIHLVVATQRPSTDVVTGLIKANFPARIAFTVASSIDSRVILDTTGAETLLGRGDMLFLPPDVSAPIRSQGVMITDQEVERVITFWQKAHPGSETPLPAPWEDFLERESMAADRDDLVEQAIRLVRETKHASASMLQRRLKIGYPRAARLIDELEELGVIGPAQGGGRERQVLIDGVDSEENL